MPDQSRPFRRLHRSITSSERLSSVSDGAWRLAILLLANQDDDGCYPWTPSMIRSLIAGTQWTIEDAESYCKELVRTQYVQNNYLVRTQSVLSDGTENRIPCLRIWRGAELNGVPKSGSTAWREPRRYAVDGSTYSVSTQPVHDAVDGSTYSVRTQYVQNNYSVPTGREEKRSEEKNIIYGEIPHLTDDESAVLHREYDPALGAPRVALEVALALDHVSARNAARTSGSWLNFTRSWLARNVPKNGSTPTPAPRTPPAGLPPGLDPRTAAMVKARFQAQTRRRANDI